MKITLKDKKKGNLLEKEVGCVNMFVICRKIMETINILESLNDFHIFHSRLKITAR
jgi:hypothetical protein